jgi:hypothetical protein
MAARSSQIKRKRLYMNNDKFNIHLSKLREDRDIIEHAHKYELKKTLSALESNVSFNLNGKILAPFKLVEKYVAEHDNFMTQIDEEFAETSLTVFQADKVDEFKRESQSLLQDCLTFTQDELANDAISGESGYSISGYINVQKSVHGAFPPTIPYGVSVTVGA